MRPSGQTSRQAIQRHARRDPGAAFADRGESDRKSSEAFSPATAGGAERAMAPDLPAGGRVPLGDSENSPCAAANGCRSCWLPTGDRPALRGARSSRPVRQTAVTDDREYAPDDADTVADRRTPDDPPLKVRKPRTPADSYSNVPSPITTWPLTATRMPDAAPRALRAQTKPPTREEAFQAEIDAIDLALSSMVVEEPSVWKFDDLENRAEKALDHAQTAVQRGKEPSARCSLDQLAEFESIKRESDNVAQVETSTDRRNRQLVSLADGRPPTGLQQVEGQRFDAQGKLVNVVPTRPNAPPFAIANSDNQVTALVTPAPGVNLRPYIGRQVGVTGQRGFVPELKLPHITVQRVTPLESQDAVAGRDSWRR